MYCCIVITEKRQVCNACIIMHVTSDHECSRVSNPPPALIHQSHSHPESPHYCLKASTSHTVNAIAAIACALQAEEEDDRLDNQFHPRNSTRESRQS